MIVQIIDRGFYRSKTLDWDSEGLREVYYTDIKFWYKFRTKIGYTGYMDSPKFYINVFRVENIVHEYLNSSSSKIWVNEVDPTPYLKWELDEDGDTFYPNRFKEKYFYKLRFKKDDWVKIQFDEIVIKQLAPPLETDPFNANSFEIHPYVLDIRPFEVEEEIELDYLDYLAEDLPF